MDLNGEELISTQLILQSNQHHQCTDHYFSWGNRGNYGMLHNSSVSGYACKGDNKAQMNSEVIEFMMNT